MAGPGPAANPGAENLARELAHELPSPYCPGRSIASCPSGLARELEDDIFEMAVQGQGREQIETALVARFGREKMGYTQSTSVFVIVTVLALAAVVMIVRLGRKWSAKSEPAGATTGGPVVAAPVASQDELDDLEDDLDALDGI